MSTFLHSYDALNSLHLTLAECTHPHTSGRWLNNQVSSSGGSSTSDRSAFGPATTLPSTTTVVRTGCEVNARRRKRPIRVHNDRTLSGYRADAAREECSVCLLRGSYRRLERSVHCLASIFTFKREWICRVSLSFYGLTGHAIKPQHNALLIKELRL